MILMKCPKCGSDMVEVSTKIAFDVDEGIDMQSGLCPKCDKDIFDELEK